MPRVRINSLTLQGFRSFGRLAQSVTLTAPIAAIYATNSQGKTSLAEAIEFLFTGEIVRRQLIASAQDEFADALRHVHLPATMPVFVEAQLLCNDGIERILRRTLVSDYSKGSKQDCQTTLQIDGNPATEADLSALGIVLSHPPLRAPVLAQHTLGYLFSAKPQERAEYFRALLEVTDLEELRQTITGLQAELKPVDTPAWTKFRAACGVPELAFILGPFLANIPASTALTARFDQGATALITAAGQPIPTTAPERLTTVADILAARRALVLPIQAFDRKQLPPLTTPADTIQTLADANKAAAPRFLWTTSAARRTKGFTVPRIRQIAGQDHVSVALVDGWLQQLRPLARAHNRVLRGLATLHATLTALTPETLLEVADLKAAFAACAAAVTAFQTALVSYGAADLPLRTHLQETIDAAGNATGWQEFLDLATDLAVLRETLVERAARTALARELTRALSAIERGNEQVLEDKFAGLSVGVETWWNLLRPDEPTFFSGVKPRPGARRTIDFKAGLAAGDDRSTAKIRDVIAIFSQSQLHCLGLSLFLARAVHEGATFAVLDDPVLSSDENYRVFFNTTVIERLHALGIQMIILTQDQRTLTELETRYLHLGIAVFELVIESPLDGTTILDASDSLARIPRMT
jgi:hypothetical protein